MEAGRLLLPESLFGEVSIAVWIAPWTSSVSTRGTRGPEWSGPLPRVTRLTGGSRAPVPGSGYSTSLLSVCHRLSPFLTLCLSAQSPGGPSYLVRAMRCSVWGADVQASCSPNATPGAFSRNKRGCVQPLATLRPVPARSPQLGPWPHGQVGVDIAATLLARSFF